MFDEPLKLHTHTVAADGTPAWAKAFMRYIGNVIPNATREEITDWWRSDYLVDRLKQHFGEDMVEAVMAIATHQYDEEAEEKETDAFVLASWYHYIDNVPKLYRRQRQMRRMLRQRFDMPQAYF